MSRTINKRALAMFVLVLVGAGCAPEVTATPLPGTDTPTPTQVTAVSEPADTYTPTSTPTSTPTNTSTPAPTVPAKTPTVTPSPSPPAEASPTSSTRFASVEVLFCPTDDAEAMEAYDEAIGLADQGKLQEAEERYRKAIELDPGYCDAMDNMGQLLRRQGRMEEAVSWYKRSIEIAPDNFVAIQLLAVAYKIQANYEKAIAEFERLIEVVPDDPEGYYGLGTSYLDLQQPAQAIGYLEKAEERYEQTGSPWIVDAQHYLGLAHFMVDNCTKAKEYLEPIYAQLEGDGVTNYILGVCYLTSEPVDLDLARAYIQKSQELGITIPDAVLQALETPG